MLQNILTYCNKKRIVAALIDPDKTARLAAAVEWAKQRKIDLFLVGGSLLAQNNVEQVVHELKNSTDIPAVLFPGNGMQLCSKADGILFLSLVSGRNPEYLIGQQVAAAPLIHEMGLVVFPTAYLLIDGGKTSTTQYVTNTMPIPQEKVEIAVATALAAGMMGMSHCYLEAGSGALNPVCAAMINTVKKQTDMTVIVGGGIRTKAAIDNAFEAGADVVVVGSALESGELNW